MAVGIHSIRQPLARRLPVYLLALSILVVAPARAESSVEFNPVRLLSLAGSDYRTFTGGLYLSRPGSTWELAMPIAYHDDRLVGDWECCENTVVKLDLQWRRYQRADKFGRYAGVVLHGAAVRGYESASGPEITRHRLGVGGVLGIRSPCFANGTSGLMGHVYIGANISAGYYLDEPVPIEQPFRIDVLGDTVFDVSGSWYIDVELLKFGWRF